MSKKNPPWNLDRIDQRNLPYDKSFHTKADLKNGKGVNVYVLDGGIRTTHTDFGGRAVPTLETFEGFLKECDPADSTCALDIRGHGTHCAGIVAGTKYGVAKDAKVYAVKVLGDDGRGSLSSIEMGMDWLIGNAKKPAVASMSLGLTGIFPSMREAVDAMTNSGVTVVVSAGNKAIDACKHTPGHIPNALTVGSTTRLDRRSGFSNFGACLNIFAPGSDIESAGVDSDTQVTTKSGTSMACPLVAGAVALLLARSPEKTPSQLMAELQNHSTPGKVKNAGENSPNKLLFVEDEQTTTTETIRFCVIDIGALNWHLICFPEKQWWMFWK